MYMAEDWVAAAKSQILEAAVGEGGTVNRDWCNKHRGIDLVASNVLLVLVVI